MDKHKNIKQNKPLVLSFLKVSNFYNHLISMVSKGPLNPVAERGHYDYAVNNRFSNYLVNVPTPKHNDNYALNSKIQHRLSKTGPTRKLIVDRRTDNLKT